MLEQYRSKQYKHRHVKKISRASGRIRRNATILVLKKTIFTILFSFFLITDLYSEESFISLEKLKNHDMDKVIFLRHALAPGNGDPSNFNVNDCSTQRNLDQVGIVQSRMLGNTLKKIGIKFSKIYSSFWCRCKDTTLNMNIGEFKTHEGLNSFYEKHADRKLTLIKLNNLVNSFDKLGGPYLLVTHYVNILAFTGLSTTSGGMVAFDLNSQESIHIKFND